MPQPDLAAGFIPSNAQIEFDSRIRHARNNTAPWTLFQSDKAVVLHCQAPKPGQSDIYIWYSSGRYLSMFSDIHSIVI